MSAYFCSVNLPAAPVQGIVAVSGCNDQAEGQQMVRGALDWPGCDTIALHDGERPVVVLANPILGFAPEPLDLIDLAA